MSTKPAIDFERIKNVHQTPFEEFYASGHRTCQGCESALVMREFAKASGPRTIATGATGCMYVANTSYQTTPWVIPWMHTQLGAGGASAVGTAAGLRALMRKGKIKKEKINVINFSGDLGGGDMGVSGISGALQSDYDLLIIIYDNESAANTDIQATGMTTYGAQTTFTPPGSKHRIMQRRWKKEFSAHVCSRPPKLPLCCDVLSNVSSIGLSEQGEESLEYRRTYVDTYIRPLPKRMGLPPEIFS